jgi:phospholipid/cholesterol/gamma-HCH transport system substrate-binding protein
MRLSRHTWIQVVVLSVISVTALAYMVFNYMRLPTLLFDVGHYTVTVHLRNAGGLYKRANVTYRGTEVGIVKDVDLTETGVDAVLSLRSDIPIPSNLEAAVHSTSAVGEQYVALLPRGGGPTLKNGDSVDVANSSVPPDINSLLDATNRGLKAIPEGDLQTVVNEAYTAVAGLGPEISRFVRNGSKLAIDSRAALPEQLNVADNVAPILDTQTDTSHSVAAWASNLARITNQLQNHDQAVRGVITTGAGAADELQQLLDRANPTFPVLAANLASVAPVLVTYRADLEQLLVLVPQGIAGVQALAVANKGTRQAYKGGFLSFNLNANHPPPCTTGFLPVQQQRVPSVEDYPERPTGDLYCRVPQDSPLNVRGARNIPCETRPGKRAPTVKMCESDENYVPLNDGLNWKGDPNATWSGQGVPQLPPGTPAAPSGAAAPAPAPHASAAAFPPTGSPIAVTHYDPATGMYVGPDGRVYTQSDLSASASKDKTWQQLLLPPPQG